VKKGGLQVLAIAALGLGLAFMGGFIAGRGNLILAKEAMGALRGEALYGLSSDEMDRAAVQGMIDNIPDPMAAYLSPELLDSFRGQIAGSEEVGLGIEAVRVRNGYYVCSVMERSPAQIGGVAKGDVIVTIDGAAVEDGKFFPTMVENQRVELCISRNGVVRTQALFAQKVAPFPDVEQKWLNENTGYVRIRSFTQTGMEEEAVKALMNCLARGVAILDLRHNPGGRLEAATSIAQMFVKKGETLLVLHEAGGKREILKSRGGSHTGCKLVVLVDQKSASAAEVLAGILKEYGAATIIGQTTYGKGTVQRVKTLCNGSGIRFTIAEYGLPSGEMIDGKGIVPDIAVIQSEIPGFALSVLQDEALQAALSHLAFSVNP
jgi:carboxyl-terminal processing protease